MPWWGWIALGTLLLGSEMLLVDLDFYLVFLGMSALLVGVAALAGLDDPTWIQWLLFAGLSLVTLVGFRQRVYGKLRGNVPGLGADFVDEKGRARERIEPNENGSVELRGSVWNARNEGEQPIEAGGQARVVRTEGVTLVVRGD